MFLTKSFDYLQLSPLARIGDLHQIQREGIQEGLPQQVFLVKAQGVGFQQLDQGAQRYAFIPVFLNGVQEQFLLLFLQSLGYKAEGMVHHVKDYLGGKYGFVSGHATNSFAIATFVVALIGKHYKYLTPLVLIWAVLVSYSRIYLGVHYPLDILGGALLGIGLGFLVFKLYMWFGVKYLKKTFYG